MTDWTIKLIIAAITVSAICKLATLWISFKRGK